MKVVNIHEAKTHLSRLLAEVRNGGEVTIANAGRPVAKLVRFSERHPRRQLGAAAGTVTFSHDFDAPLPGEVRKAFGS